MGEKINIRSGLRRPKREKKTFGPISSPLADQPFTLTVSRVGFHNIMNAKGFGDELRTELDTKPVTVEDEVVLACPNTCEMVTILVIAQPEVVYTERELIALCVVDEFRIAMQSAHWWACYGDIEGKDKDGDGEDGDQSDPLVTPPISEQS